MPNGQYLVVRMGVASAISFEQDLVIVGEAVATALQEGLIKR